ncbi:hypothetical protein B566_EDAN010420 [Ephemera danica]|nr:hypothetical protein B566_EDAN010420 [Ephemera danica]
MADMAPEEERRPSVQSLWEAALALQPPTTWPTPPPGMTMPEDSSGSPAAWLVALATCPARTEWRDLGVFFWPRLVRREECERGPARRKPGASSVPLGCGWPPGRLTCAPGVTRTLHLLRWHCRLRDAAEETWTRLAQVMTPGKVPPQPPPRRKRRERYRCEWLKVPYPVPADCQCGGI